VDRYSFTVWLFHPLHPAGFSGAPGFRIKYSLFLCVLRGLCGKFKTSSPLGERIKVRGL